MEGLSAHRPSGVVVIARAALRLSRAMHDAR
jgi:hypothetical protein